jgi:SM-20-related protein
MISPNLVEQLRQLSHRDKLNVIQLLVSELNFLDLDRNVPTLPTSSAAVGHLSGERISGERISGERISDERLTSDRPVSQTQAIRRASAAIALQPAAATGATATLKQSQPQVAVFPSQFVQLADFLSPADHQALVQYTLDHEAEFVGTTTSTGDLEYRQSMVLYYFDEMRSRLEQAIRQALPTVLAQLQLDPFEASAVEAQLTAHNDGHYYKIHNDNGSPDTANRVLTYVYYFNHPPKGFDGGALRIYDSQVKQGCYVAADSYQDVMPNNNSIVFFLSRYMHEVLPITCASRLFRDSRFTINGWLRK